jgi:hypothetical protein
MQPYGALVMYYISATVRAWRLIASGRRSGYSVSRVEALPPFWMLVMAPAIDPLRIRRECYQSIRFICFGQAYAVHISCQTPATFVLPTIGWPISRQTLGLHARESHKGEAGSQPCRSANMDIVLCCPSHLTSYQLRRKLIWKCSHYDGVRPSSGSQVRLQSCMPYLAQGLTISLSHAHEEEIPGTVNLAAIGVLRLRRINRS